MREKLKVKYPVKGSNVLYKVWGSFVLLIVFFTIILNLFGMGLMLDDFLKLINLFEIFKTKIVIIYVVVIMIFICGIINLGAQILSGIFLMKNYVTSAGIYIVLAVLCFRTAYDESILLLESCIAGSWVTVIWTLLLMIWYCLTGILLLSKSGKADKNLNLNSF